MKKLSIAALLLCSAFPCLAQLTQEQKVSDFMGLAALYDKNYGPYQWKMEAFHVDLLKIRPWLEQVERSRDDLAFYDICVRYVASLHDFHDEFTLPSYYEAYLPLTADIYDGKVLIDFVNTFALDPASYPISIGDEIISVDGVSTQRWIEELAPYSVNGEGNPVSRDRLAVATMLDRYQGWYTYANKVKPGQVATVKIKGASGTASYQIAWQVIGVPLTSEGPVPNLRDGFSGGHGRGGDHDQPWHSMRETGHIQSNAWGLGSVRAAAAVTTAPTTTTTPTHDKSDLIKRFRDFSYLHPNHILAGGLNPFGSFYPVFNPPAGFKVRLGRNLSDEFLSGIFPVGSSTVGYIRIPSFEPSNEGLALSQFASEIAYFQTNTSGLVVDVMSNGGGNVCYAQAILQYLIPANFRGPAFSLRATENWLEYFEGNLLNAEFGGAPQSVVDQYAQLLQQVEDALAQKRGMTGPLPLCSFTLTTPPATDANGINAAYTKPILVLADNFSASAAELFGATLQDAQRATVYGTRTSGGGGNVVSFDVAPFAEGSTRATESIAIRNHNVATPGYPAAPYIENIGVYPDILADFQTRGNLVTGGRPFVLGFSSAIGQLIAAGH